MRVLRDLIAGFIAFTLLFGSSVGFATGIDEPEFTEDEQKTIEDLKKQAKLEDNLKFLKRLEDEYTYSRSSFDQVEQTVEDTKAKLRDVYSEGVSLKEQINILNRSVENTNKKLAAISKQLAKKNNMIDILERQIKEQEQLYDKQKEFLADYVRLLYMQEQNYFDASDGSIDAFRFLLSEEHVSELVNENEYFEILNFSADEMLSGMVDNEEKLRMDKAQIQEERIKIAELTSALKAEKRHLDSQKRAKVALLKDTKGSQEIFQNILQQSKKEQKEARNELLELRSNLQMIKSKIDKLGADFDPEDYEDLLDKTSKEVYEFYLSAANNGDVYKMAWPVLPDADRGLSAYFKDSAYRAWAGIPHNAIDIPAPQGTIIRAPLDCIVYKTKDNGFGYSYVSLACKGGYFLNFGHIIEFLKEEGDKVRVGEEIALSGGMPGTRGAGYLTTGPHVHFEVMKDGKYVDPLDYLDLSLLPFDNLPKKHQDRLNKKVNRKARKDGLVIK